MREQMMQLAEELRFEEAQEVKQRYELIENFRAKSEVVSAVLHNIDVFNIETDEKLAFINYLHVKNGCINQAFTFSTKSGSMNQTRNCSPWASSKCATATAAPRAKLWSVSRRHSR